MKRMLFLCLAGLALVDAALAQPSQTYLNTGTVSAPPATVPVIDATNFVNTGSFNIDFTNLSYTIPLFETSDTLNFTNKNIITGNTGYRFDTAPSSTGSRRMAANFVNTTTGSISVGSATNTFFQNAFLNNSVFNSFFLGGGAKMVVWATNIISPGTIDIGLDGLLTMHGKNVDLTRGGLIVEGSDAFLTGTNLGFFVGGLFNGGFANIGIFDRYWGIGMNTNQTGFYGPIIASSPAEYSTNSFGQTQFGSLVLTNFTAFAFTNQVNASNNFVDVVLLQNTNSAVTTDVRFQDTGGPMIPVVKWTAVVTNGLGALAAPVTNNLFLSDTFASDPRQIIALNAVNLLGQPTFAPINYTFSRVDFFGFPNLLPPNTPYNPILVVPNRTNYYSFYGVDIEATTALVPSNVPGASTTNMPGRIEITADKVLNLERVRVSGPNYLLLRATNHFVGSTNAQIAVPNSDIYLASTNGSMVISNLLAPVVPRMIGNIDLWSGRWTNVVAGVTNQYHVMLVNSDLAPTSPSLIKDLTLRSTNLVVSDILNITHSVLLDVERLTVVSNAAGFNNPFGEINFTDTSIVWDASLPRLQYFTNSGLVTILNSTFLGGTRQPPFFTGTFTEPYQALVNHGTISAAGSTIWANYFENIGARAITTNFPPILVPIPGVVLSTIGSIDLQANVAVLENGMFSAPFGEINVASSSLVASNHTMHAGQALSFSVTNSFSDGGANSSNLWQCGNGFNLFVKPGTGDLLGTTVTNVCPNLAQVDNVWAGEDRGCSPAGFANNMAIGHLILDGGLDCQFNFKAAGAQNAIYIDLLELKDYTTNRANPDFTALNIDPNMMVYFADARIGNIDISEKLNGANGGRLCWVSSFAGPFSSMNIAYPSGKIYTFNRALAQSSSFDSDGDGIVNSADSTPFVTPENVRLSVSMTKQPKPAAQITWMALANSTNTLYCTTSIKSANWVTLTNFIQGPLDGQVTITDPAKTNGPCFYRLRIGAK
jgi:hypothetical protein